MNNVTPRSKNLRELLHPIGLTVCQTQGLARAARLLRDTGAGHVVITNMSEQPLGLITERDIEKFKQLHPAKWASKRCACAVREQLRVQIDDPMDSVVEVLSHNEIRPPSGLRWPCTRGRSASCRSLPMVRCSQAPRS